MLRSLFVSKQAERLSGRGLTEPHIVWVENGAAVLHGDPDEIAVVHSGSDDEPPETANNRRRHSLDATRFMITCCSWPRSPRTARDAASSRLCWALFTTKPGGMKMGRSTRRPIIEAPRGRPWARPNATDDATFQVILPRMP